MISRFVKIQLAVFSVLAVLALLITGVNYVGLDKKLWNQPMKIKAHFDRSGGIFPNAEVTYRGVEVGRVGTLTLTREGVIVELQINKGQKIPANTHAQVEELSAVGEQYVDLRPMSDGGPYLKDGSVIPISQTSVPIDENTVLVDLNRLLQSVPKDALSTTVDELGTAFEGLGPDLQRIIDRGNELLQSEQANLPETIRLIEDARQVLATQIDVNPAFQTFAHDIADVSDTLRQADPDIRRLFDNGIVASQELTALFNDLQPQLPTFLGNLITLGQITQVRLPGVDEFLTLYPKVIQGGMRVVADPAKGANFAMVLDQAPVCTSGYKPKSQWRPASNVDDAAPLQYTCQEPISSSIDVRGSREAPRPGGDTTDPALGGYAYGQSLYPSGGTGSSGSGGIVTTAGGRVVDNAAWDPDAGLLTGPNGEQYLLGADGGQAQVLGAQSWMYPFLAPLTA